tara:strand:+ start:4220 stop:4456 length:237 start_codon:yes stop_codon:yes gene_type:complete
MFSLIQKMYRRALSLDALDSKLRNIEERVAVLENISDERDSLWLFIEEMQEQERITYQVLQDELNDAIVRSMKPQGEA